MTIKEHLTPLIDTLYESIQDNKRTIMSQIDPDLEELEFYSKKLEWTATQLKYLLIEARRKSHDKSK